MRHSPPTDPRRRAFAEALGRLLAEVVWAELIADEDDDRPRFEFSDFILASGVTVRFVGSNPAVIRVRGPARIDGRMEANAEAMTPFQCRDRFSTALLPGQPGGRGGPGGGRGGKGGDRCSGNGPTIVAGVNTNDGQTGEDVQLPAGHAYLSRAASTDSSSRTCAPFRGRVPPRRLFALQSRRT